MKRLLKYISIIILLVTIWTVSVFYATDKGWLYQPFTGQQKSDEFILSVHEELQKEFVGTMAMALFQNGELVKESFYQKGKKVDSNTVFQVASLSKFVSAIGVMRLVQDGKIALDTPVSHYLTRWQLPTGKFDNDEVTVRRLLSHTAGLTDGLGYSGFTNIEDVQTLESSLSKAADADPGKDGRTQVGILPGSEWRYSGGGFTLLQLIVEEASGQSFDEYMRSEIFEPLSMHSSFYQWDEAYRDRLCEFYNSDGTKAPHFYYTSQAATSLYTTLSDLESLFYHLQSNSGSSKPISKEYQRMMWHVEARKLGAPIYGLGTFLFAETDDSQFVIGHDGQSNPPINTAFRFNTATNDGLIILTTGSSDFATRIASDWVFLKTGEVDALLFVMQQDIMTKTVLIGGIFILILSLSTAYYRKHR